jgi:hypothetical protein
MLKRHPTPISSHDNDAQVLDEAVDRLILDDPRDQPPKPPRRL